MSVYSVNTHSLERQFLQVMYYTVKNAEVTSALATHDGVSDIVKHLSTKMSVTNTCLNVFSLYSVFLQQMLLLNVRSLT